ncbi:MAG: hypothetical protein H6816_09650 [Phycisphaerales bacterium]|nr:hypothetical protein [Phycisphaerales bacterium]
MVPTGQLQIDCSGARPSASFEGRGLSALASAALYEVLRRHELTGTDERVMFSIRRPGAVEVDLYRCARDNRSFSLHGTLIGPKARAWCRALGLAADAVDAPRIIEVCFDVGCPAASAR